MRFYSEKELELLSRAYDVMNAIKRMKTSKYEKNYWTTISLKNSVEELKDLIQFISLNIEIVEHVFTKIDKHT